MIQATARTGTFVHVFEERTLRVQRATANLFAVKFYNQIANSDSNHSDENSVKNIPALLTSQTVSLTDMFSFLKHW